VAKKSKKYAKKKPKPKQAAKKVVKKDRKKPVRKPTKTKGKGKGKSKPVKLAKKSLSKNKARKRDKPVTNFVKLKNKEDRRKRSSKIKIIFRTRTFQNKINELRNFPTKILDYYTIREKGFPFAVQTILTTKMGTETFARASRFSSYDFHVDSENTIQFGLESMIAYQDNYIEYIEDNDTRKSDWVYNPKNIIEITFIFIYPVIKSRYL